MIGADYLQLRSIALQLLTHFMVAVTVTFCEYIVIIILKLIYQPIFLYMILMKKGFKKGVPKVEMIDCILALSFYLMSLTHLSNHHQTAKTK